jgi:hypothetical protein
LPAVVGGGLGDIAEVLDAGRVLRHGGFPTILFRPAGRPAPRDLDGPWGFEGVERRTTLAPHARRALTVTPNWGVSAAPDRPGALGRGGVWSEEAEAIERRYGRDATVHVSLEEFARTLTSREENAERWREGGRTAREIRRLRRTAAFAKDVERFHREFRRFRGFDRPNVLHLFQTFRPRAAFAREFPEAVQVGPIWPAPAVRPHRSARASVDWVWYASPSSSAKSVAEIDRGLRGSPVRGLTVRSPRALPIPRDSPVRWSVEPARSPAVWGERFAAASLRIVTGSRTLLEALALGGPFLYDNGVLGGGRRRHRHRPEKIRSLLAGWRSRGESPTVLRDLDSFSRGRRVASVVRAAATDPEWSRRFPRLPPVDGFPNDRRDGGAYLLRVARAFATDRETSTELVRRLREGAPVRRRH